MASLNDIDRLINYLAAGGSAKDAAKKLKINPVQLAALLVSDPEKLSKLATATASQYGQYERFNPNVSYTSDNPATNPALDKYKAYPEKYRALIGDFASTVLKEGPYAINSVFGASNKEQIAQAYGLDVNEYNQLINDLIKDAPNIVSGESSRQAKEYASFQKKRAETFKAGGVEPSGPQGGVIRAAFGSKTGSPELYNIVDAYQRGTSIKSPDWLLSEGGNTQFRSTTKNVKPTLGEKRRAKTKYESGSIDLLKALLDRSL